MKKKVCAFLSLAVITLSFAFAPMQAKAYTPADNHWPECYKTEFLDETIGSCTAHKNCQIAYRRYKYYYICTDCDYMWTETKTIKYHQSKK